MASNRLIGKLIKQGLVQIFEGLKGILDEEERRRVENELRKYLNLSDSELGDICTRIFERHALELRGLHEQEDEIIIYMAALKLACGLLDLPEEIQTALRSHLAQYLRLPSA
ncbi:MAG: hypothetical protein DRG31_03500 [Deltaproteobacteria bacterium]|nr:MAG: hypothetical protein DRG31_03500 [Deltaproteobacteria bacterium]